MCICVCVCVHACVCTICFHACVCLNVHPCVCTCAMCVCACACVCVCVVCICICVCMCVPACIYARVCLCCVCGVLCALHVGILVLKQLRESIKGNNVDSFHHHLNELERVVQNNERMGQLLEEDGLLCLAASLGSNAVVETLIQKGIGKE